MANKTSKVVYAVTEKGEKTFWTRIGAATENGDGSITLKLDCLPLSDVLSVRDEMSTIAGPAPK